MEFTMFFLRKQFQVRQAVVGFVEVAMMDLVAIWDWSIRRLPDHSMFQFVSLGANEHKYILSLATIAATFPVRVIGTGKIFSRALERTESLCKRARSCCLKLHSAGWTCHIDRTTTPVSRALASAMLCAARPRAVFPATSLDRARCSLEGCSTVEAGTIDGHQSVLSGDVPGLLPTVPGVLFPLIISGIRRYPERRW
jgi:hypothetical protein